MYNLKNQKTEAVKSKRKVKHRKLEVIQVRNDSFQYYVQ